MNKKDLHKIAPKLSEISLHKIGFEIPENYFETIEDAVMAEIKAKNIAHKKTSDTFKTPENYFSSVEDIVIAKLKAEAIQNTVENTSKIPENYFSSIEDAISTKLKTNSKVISLKSKFARVVAPLAIAASLLLIFILKNDTTTLTFDSLTSSDIENWIDNGGIDIDALSIASIYPEIELNNDMYSATLSDNEVLNYLYEEDLDEIIYEN